MDLTLQVPMQYCSLQHCTLLPSPVTSITGCCFHFVSISSFFLELFLHSSLVAYGHLPTWRIHLLVSYLFAFSYCSWGSQGKNAKWLSIPFSSGPRFVRTLTMTHPSCVALHGMAHSFIVSDKIVIRVVHLISFCD